MRAFYVFCFLFLKKHVSDERFRRVRQQSEHVSVLLRHEHVQGNRRPRHRVRHQTFVLHPIQRVAVRLQRVLGRRARRAPATARRSVTVRTGNGTVAQLRLYASSVLRAVLPGGTGQALQLLTVQHQNASEQQFEPMFAANLWRVRAALSRDRVLQKRVLSAKLYFTLSARVPQGAGGLHAPHLLLSADCSQCRAESSRSRSIVDIARQSE